MIDLPAPNDDGTCLNCNRDAVTNDGRFCRKHLTGLVASINRYVLDNQPREELDRPLLTSYKAIGGSPDMRPTEGRI